MTRCRTHLCRLQPGERIQNNYTNIPLGEIKADIDAILWSMRLCQLRRFFHQRYWENETRDAEYANKIESSPRLESVAEHSWLVADAVLIIGPHFEKINLPHCTELAILHDKLENITGDKNPVGRDGTGLKTHAFSEQHRMLKDNAEIEALNIYLDNLRPQIRDRQRKLLLEIIDGKTDDALFVKAIDKLLALAFVYKKKKGNISDKHLHFTYSYSRKICNYFPQMQSHYEELLNRFIASVAIHRSVSIESIMKSFYRPKQGKLF
jgi:5'-deoxynucleotidase YfbR-like HD superfamily hydrolase